MSNNKNPVLLTPAYFTHVWGGELLKEKLNKDYTENNIGESWEVSAHPRGNSVVASGQYEGMAFGEYYTKVLGNKDPYSLLIKLIGPKRDLSVQVHPNNEYAKLHENSLGKKEAWYVLSSPENGQIIVGVNSTKEQFEKALSHGNIKSTLEYINCRKGDVISINPGTVHALLKDVIVYEVQQNSDITYRIYDWDRADPRTKEPRELHIDKALDVIAFNKSCAITKSGNSAYQLLADNEYFSMAKITFDGAFAGSRSAGGAYTLIEGSGQIMMDDKVIFEVTKGQSFYAPMGNNFTIQGKGEMLKSTEK